MICALWGVDLKFPLASRASPRCSRPVALASRASPLAPRLSRSCSPCSFPLVSRVSRIPRHASLAPRSPGHGKQSTKNRFHDNRSGCVGHCRNHFFSLQPLSWRHCKNHFLSIVSQTPLDACPAPWHAMLGGCGPPPPGEALRRSPPSRHARRLDGIRKPVPPLVTRAASVMAGIPAFWHPDILTS